VSGANRIAKITAGIAVAMRFVHSRGVTHRDLKPANILLDWDWTVWIADFGHSTARPSLPQSRADCRWPSFDSRYLAPECYEINFLPASDVFAFGLILFEIVAGRPAFPERLRLHRIAFIVAVEGGRPDIPDEVLPAARELIQECWAADPDDRPTFEGIVNRLEEMQFQVTSHVNSAKVAGFVKRIEDWETLHQDD
jgi:serine/threonine protein kinase